VVVGGEAGFRLQQAQAVAEAGIAGILQALGQHVFGLFQAVLAKRDAGGEQRGTAKGVGHFALAGERYRFARNLRGRIGVGVPEFGEQDFQRIELPVATGQPANAGNTLIEIVTHRAHLVARAPRPAPSGNLAPSLASRITGAAVEAPAPVAAFLPPSHRPAATRTENNPPRLRPVRITYRIETRTG